MKTWIFAITAALGLATAHADQPHPPAPGAPGQAAKPDPTLTPMEITEREQAYLAALKKCESATEAERPKCVESVKRKHGLM